MEASQSPAIEGGERLNRVGGLDGSSEPECPVEAIKPDTEDDPDGKWLAINSKYAEIWPVITVKIDPPEDAAKFDTETGKFEKYFSGKPGKGS